MPIFDVEGVLRWRLRPEAQELLGRGGRGQSTPTVEQIRVGVHGIDASVHNK